MRLPVPEHPVITRDERLRLSGAPARAEMVEGRRVGRRAGVGGVGRRPQRGFTLIELIVSVALMALILGAGYLCLNAALDSQRVAEARGDALQAARVALNLMAADLRAACPLDKDLEFVGLDRTLDGIEADNLDFATHHYQPRRAMEGDYCQVSYYVARDPATGGYALWRRRNPMLAPDPLSGGRRERIVSGLRGLRLEYYDGWEWFDEWGDPGERLRARASLRPHYNVAGLPEAVRITLWIAADAASKRRPDDRGEERAEHAEPPLVLQTVVRLNLAAASSQEAEAGSSAGRTPSASPTSPAPGAALPMEGRP